MALFAKKPFILPLVVFGGLAALILAASGMLIVKALQRAPASDGLGAETGQIFAATPAEVVSQYAKSVDSLHNALQSYTGSREEFFAFAENALLTMRVPKEMLDAHIAAVLKIRNLHAGAQNSEERARAISEVEELGVAKNLHYE